MGSLGEHSVEESVVLSRTKWNGNGYSFVDCSVVAAVNNMVSPLAHRYGKPPPTSTDQSYR